MSQPTLTVPLPRFGRQPIDDPLPENMTVTPAVTDDPSPGPLLTPGPGLNRSPLSGPTDPESDPGRPPALSPDHPTHTGTSGTSRAPRGDAKTAGEVIAGLFGVLCFMGYTWAARRGIAFRQPNNKQLSDASDPLGRIAARHLPTDLIGPDVVDATRAVGAIHAYILDGPMFTRVPIEPQGDELP